MDSKKADGRGKWDGDCSCGVGKQWESDTSATSTFALGATAERLVAGVLLSVGPALRLEIETLLLVFDEATSQGIGNRLKYLAGRTSVHGHGERASDEGGIDAYLAA